jgi:hypothetical protein
MFRSSLVVGLAAAVAVALSAVSSADAARGGKHADPVDPMIVLDDCAQ